MTLREWAKERAEKVKDELFWSYGNGVNFKENTDIIESALLEAAAKGREEALGECLLIAQGHGCVPCNGSLGSLEADCIHDEIRNILEKKNFSDPENGSL